MFHCLETNKRLWNDFLEFVKQIYDFVLVLLRKIESTLWLKILNFLTRKTKRIEKQQYCNFQLWWIQNKILGCILGQINYIELIISLIQYFINSSQYIQSIIAINLLKLAECRPWSFFVLGKSFVCLMCFQLFIFSSVFYAAIVFK